MPSTYDTILDRPTLKSLAVRSEIAGRMGVKLASGEDPGPLDVGNPRVQRAIEAAFGERFVPEVVAALKRRATEAATPASAPAASPPPDFYRGLAERMIAETDVPAPPLAQLAAARRDAIITELTGPGAMPKARVTPGETRAADPVGDKTVRLKLQLGPVE